MAHLAYPVDKAWLVGILVEGVLYGINIVLFGFSLAFLVWRRETANINWLMLLSTCVIFMASTAHFGIAFNNLVTAFITQRDAPGGPAAIINSADLVFPINLMFSINNFLGDCLLTYRCWLVWQKSIRIALVPILLLVVYIASAIVGLYNFHQEAKYGNHFTAGIADFGTASFAISLALNILVTSLIAGRIYHLARQTRAVLPPRHAKQYMTIITIILESGALFTAAQVIFLAIWHQSIVNHATGADAITAVMVAQIYCIVPTLIIVRVGSGKAYDDTTALGTRGAVSTLVFSTEPPIMSLSSRRTQAHSDGAHSSTYYGSQSAADAGDNEMTAIKTEV
ncbi:hypothetical protein OE88DRAFT_1733375 [Heliocybe sulcata]|uniref:Uncharacterized protein n=1 Tax=Heliocybe sulcata TaxID=5364 RepID=A0A5C3N804_9AGAM|nr:hypothetical protein OE88DRAFT_1733375 [Heliocybe sulcata]